MRYCTPLLSILTITILVFTSGCKKTNSSPPAFLQVGHQWVYLEQSYNGPTDTLTVLIAGTDPEKEFVVKFHNSIGDSSIQYWYMDGDYVREYTAGYPSQQATKFWNINAVAGQTWNSPVPDSIGGIQYDNVLGLNVADTTIAGVFNTTEVQFANSNVNGIEQSYISNSLGEVSRTGGAYHLNLVSKNF